MTAPLPAPGTDSLLEHVHRASDVVPSRPPAAEAAELARFTPRTAGAALDPRTRRVMGARFGYDFGRVRVHGDTAAADLAEAADARAYTIGSHVVFGPGQYAPGTPAGQALLAHELSHVVQQACAGVVAVQCDDKQKPPPNPPPVDPELALGQRLVGDFGNGIALAFFQPMPSTKDKENAMVAATAWAKREQALGIKGASVTAANAGFGLAMSDVDHPLVATVQAIGTLLNKAVAKAAPGPMPPGMGPTTVRTLGIFAHGGSDWCGIGAISSSQAASVMKSIAPTLATGINVILFSCNSGRDPDESEDWIKGSMQAGGAKSLAGVTRDALVAEGKTGATTWGHSVTGDVSTNFALREFSGIDGKGAAGASFAQRYAFGPHDQAVVAYELIAGIADGGYQVLDQDRVNKAGMAQAEQELYWGYADANAKVDYPAGGKLGESAPTHPVEVGQLVKKHWDSTYWPAKRAAKVAAFVKSMLAAGLIKKRP